MKRPPPSPALVGKTARMARPDPFASYEEYYEGAAPRARGGKVATEERGIGVRG